MPGSSDNVHEKVREAGVSEWHSSLDERNRTVLLRYIDATDASSEADFFITLIRLALKDENFAFASSVGDSASDAEMDDMQRFLFNEERISAYSSSERYADAMAVCEENLSAYPGVAGRIVEKNGGVPEKLNCRNMLIDIMVGIDSDYDGAMAAMDRFFDMGLISGEDLVLRKNSLRIHRMQRAFDGVYSYRPKGSE